MSSEQQPEKPWEHGRRGGVRIDTMLWVRVIGRDSEPVRRQGNICASGFFFEAQQWPGRPGDISVMEVSSEDGAHSFTTMASVARVVHDKEARWSSAEQGVSFQFLPSDEATRVAIAQTVRHIAQQHPEQAGELVPEEFQQAASEGEYPAVGQSAVPCIETGLEVCLVVEAPGGGKREVTGVVGDITESVQGDGTRRYWVPVYRVGDGRRAAPARASLAQPGEPAEQESLVDTLWQDLVPEARSMIGAGDSGSASATAAQLSGRLSQITMPSALWLLDQERLTGALEFRRDGEEVVLYLREGRVIDAESPVCERSPRDHLAALMGWHDGEFRFRAEAVERPDRLGVPTQRLLLELAVAADHEER